MREGGTDAPEKNKKKTDILHPRSGGVCADGSGDALRPSEPLFPAGRDHGAFPRAHNAGGHGRACPGRPHDGGRGQNRRSGDGQLRSERPYAQLAGPCGDLIAVQSAHSLAYQLRYHRSVVCKIPYKAPHAVSSGQQNQRSDAAVRAARTQNAVPGQKSADGPDSADRPAASVHAVDPGGRHQRLRIGRPPGGHARLPDFLRQRGGGRAAHQPGRHRVHRGCGDAGSELPGHHGSEQAVLLPSAQGSEPDGEPAGVDDHPFGPSQADHTESAGHRDAR